ncbi:MAG: hypothetical protein L0Y54_06995, partial [Sporichthyaceae bacterium]|nr:hypothetical protein [Sporichthyaceae bacterium]
MDQIASRAVATAERALREAELWATMATLLGGQYPHPALVAAGSLVGEGGWSLSLGDALTPELVELLASCRAAHDQAAEVRDRSFAHIASHIKTRGQDQPVLVFNGAPAPRSGMVWIRHRWTEPGIRSVAVLDEWDRQANPNLDYAERHPDGGLAGGWVGWRVHDVPPVGYRIYHLVNERIVARREPAHRPGRPIENAPPPAEPEPPPAEPEPPPTEPEPPREPDPIADTPSLRAYPTGRHDGHLPPSFSLLSVQPAGQIGLTRVSLTADGAIRILVREVAGRHCRAEIRLFVPFPDEVQALEMSPRQLATVTGVAEPPAWASPGPALGPPAESAEPIWVRPPVASLAVATAPGGVAVDVGSSTRLPVHVTGADDGPVTVQVISPRALWPAVDGWRQHGVLLDGSATIEFELSIPPAIRPGPGWLAIRAGRPGQGFAAPHLA